MITENFILSKIREKNTKCNDYVLTVNTVLLSYKYYRNQSVIACANLCDCRSLPLESDYPKKKTIASRTFPHLFNCLYQPVIQHNVLQWSNPAPTFKKSCTKIFLKWEIPFSFSNTNTAKNFSVYVENFEIKTQCFNSHIHSTFQYRNIQWWNLLTYRRLHSNQVCHYCTVQIE